MKKLILLTILLQVLLSSCGQSPLINQLSPEEFNKAISNGDAIIIDVRTDKEFKNGHIKNAGQIDFYSSDFKQKLLMLPKNQDVYLYCHSGNRSGQAAKILIKNGYTKVNNLQNGIMGWNLKGLSLIKETKISSGIIDKMESEQYQKLINSEKLVFIDFYAPWCAPCKKMMPMIKEMKKEYKNKVEIVKVNTDASKKLVKNLQISRVPYLVFYYKGELLFSKKGAIGKQELKTIFDKNISY